MGLDQYAYVAMKNNQQREFYEGAEFINGDYTNPNMSRPREIAYWRKHPNLQGWMEKLWIEKGYPGLDADQNKFDVSFNGIEVELDMDDLDRLEQAVLSGSLPPTTGFFFGNPSDEYYQDHDLKFIREARAEIVLGFKVFYNSSW